MKNSSRVIIGKNIKAIRLQLGLSQLNFSILSDLSKATIVNIENGRNGYNLNLIDKILSFTDYSLSEISNDSFYPSMELKEKLTKKYQKGQLEFYNILNKKPEIVFAIKYKLLSSTFFTTFREIKEIRSFFLQFNWQYKGTSISNALKRKPDLIEIQNHELKKNTMVYRRKIIISSHNNLN